MRMTQLFMRTLREVPAEAEIPSHIWLLRAGMIRKLVSGIYGFMPLGKRSLAKIEKIIREEMEKRGSQEILMSAIQPAELWQESGRWYAYGPEMWRLKDRHNRDFCLGPTHEEVFTDIVRNDVDSYRQLPLNLYQVQTKYRDEQRPRFGLMRSREFIMKDAYSFDRDEEGLDVSYKSMYEAYEDIFNRCGLTYRAVEADTGAIGGSDSHEFCAISEFGESEIAYCDSCSMSATVERAACVDDPEDDAPEKNPEDVYTPDTKTIAEVAAYLGLSEKQTLKALLFEADGLEHKYVAAFVRGDRDLNMTKLVNALGIPEHAIAFADEDAMGEVTGSVGGFTGPAGLRNCIVVIDSELPKMKNLCGGANRENYHTVNLNFGRDYTGDILTDIKLIKEGYPCPVCSGKIKITRGIEVGQVFKLGTKYSQAMGATYKDENMQEHVIHMGCYGIGVSRTLAAIVEQYHDEDGIIWPLSVAPYHVIVTVVNMDDLAQKETGEKIYNELLKAGVQVLLDDRNERPGVKFKDADMIGIPLRITVGKKAAEGIVEYKLRKEKEKTEKTVEDAIKEALILTEGYRNDLY